MIDGWYAPISDSSIEKCVYCMPATGVSSGYMVVVVSCSSGPQNRCRFAVIYKHFEYKMLVGHIM